MKSVVICGSARFKPEIREFTKKLKSKGVVVFEPHLHRGDQKVWDALPEDYKEYISLGLTYDHFQKIRQADVTYIYNKDGYVGNSTTLEIGYSAACANPIYAYDHDAIEGCRDCLFKDIVKTPDDLVKLLQ